MPPFRILSGRDMLNRNCEKRLSDARFLMEEIEKQAKSLDLQIGRCDEEKAAEIFAQCERIREVSNTTKGNRK